MWKVRSSEAWWTARDFSSKSGHVVKEQTLPLATNSDHLVPYKTRHKFTFIIQCSGCSIESVSHCQIWFCVGGFVLAYFSGQSLQLEDKKLNMVAITT